MFKRCIMIFPSFENGQVIDEIRQKYDPLANHVKPHITLVFPFDSEIETEELREHITLALIGCNPFEIVLSKITGVSSHGSYLFLNVQEGNKNIIEIHRRLYSGILQKYFPEWLKGNNYMPHMTVGSFLNEEDFNRSVNEIRNVTEIFRSTVNEISVEIIDENEDSIIELRVPLK